jgi:hypothetical protein
MFPTRLTPTPSNKVWPIARPRTVLNTVVRSGLRQSLSPHNVWRIARPRTISHILSGVGGGCATARGARNPLGEVTY